MTSDWKEYTLEQISTILGDGLHGTPKYSINGKYAFINGNNLSNGKIIIKSDTKRVDKCEYEKYKKDLNNRTLLVSINGTLGNIAEYNEEKIILGKSACYFNVKEDIDKYFIKYILLSKTFQDYLNNQATGTTIKNISLKQMREYNFLLPPLETQQKIARVLSAIDDKIELNNSINNNLEQQIFTIFDNIFPNVRDGENTISNYFSPKRGKNLLSKNAILGDVPVIAGGLNPATYHNVANTNAPVITISASGANAGFVNLWHIPVWSSDSSYIDNTITSNIYFWYVMLKKRQQEIFDSQTGSAQPHIYPQHIEGMTVSDIDMNLVNDFNNNITPLFINIGKNIKENQKLIQLRDTLLPKLMSGEIDVSNVDISADNLL